MFMYYLLLGAILLLTVTAGMIPISIVARIPWGWLQLLIRLPVSLFSWMTVFLIVTNPNVPFYEKGLELYRETPTPFLAITTLVLGYFLLITVIQWIAFTKINAEDSEEKPMRKAATWRLGWMFRNLGLSILLFLFCYFTFDYLVCARMRHDLAAAEARVTQHLKPAVPEQENANYYYSMALEELKSKEEEIENPEDESEDYGFYSEIAEPDKRPEWFHKTYRLHAIYATDIEEVREYIKKHEKALNFAMKGANQSVYQTISQDEPERLKDEINFDDYKPISVSEALLCWQANLAIIDNKPEIFADTINALLNLKKQRQGAFRGPHWLLTIHLDRQLSTITEHILAKPEFPVSEELIEKILGQKGDVSLFIDDLDEDEREMTWFGYNMYLGEYDKIPKYVSQDVRDLPSYMKLLGSVTRSFSRVFRAPDAVFNVSSAYEQTRKILSSSSAPEVKSNQFEESYLAMNELTADYVFCSIPIHLSTDAANDAGFLKTGLIIQKFYKDNNHYPSSWDDLIPKYLSKRPVYNLEGEPIHFANISEGIVLYREHNYSEPHDKDLGILCLGSAFEKITIEQRHNEYRSWNGDANVWHEHKPIEEFEESDDGYDEEFDEE